MKDNNSENRGRSLLYYMRVLHRDIGFFIIGLTVLFSLSGIILLYRDRGLLRNETVIDTSLPVNLNSYELGRQLKINKFRITKIQGDIIHFRHGTYNKTTGETHAKKYSYPYIIQKINKFHMQSSRRLIHIAAAAYGVLLMFLAVSSFFMYKPGSNQFKRGVIISLCGFIFIAAALIIF